MNIILLFVGVCLLIFGYLSSNTNRKTLGNPKENKLLSIVYFSLGIIFIILTFIQNKIIVYSSAGLSIIF